MVLLGWGLGENAARAPKFQENPSIAKSELCTVLYNIPRSF